MSVQVVKIGPNKLCGKSLMKEIFSRKYHLDLVFKCKDGICQAHRFMVAAQSKFLKRLLLEQEGVDVAEIYLPGVRVEHFKRALRFMYTGKINVTTAELHKTYLVWHVRQIITDILKIDANLNLGDLELKAPPPEKDEEDDSDEPPDPSPGESSSGANGNGSRSSSGNQRHTTGDNPGLGPRDNVGSDTNGFRQNSGAVACGAGPRTDANHQQEAPIRERRDSEGSDIQVVEAPRVATPEIIDLLDSDDESQPEKNAEDIQPGTNGRLEECVEEHRDPLSLSTVDQDSSLVFYENAEDDTEGFGDISIAEAPKVTPKLSDPDTAATDEPCVAKKKRGRKKGSKKKSFSSVATVKKEPPVASIKPILNTIRPLPVRIPYYGGDSSKIVYRGKLINPDEKPKPTAAVKGIRKHIHNAFTLTGLKRAESLVAVKEEEGEHHCQKCPAVFQKHRSLVVHRQRMHNPKLTAKCNECGKHLSSKGSMKKHLLSHKPEHLWPYECPICHKKFQARADIPKHLMTKLHEDDNIPICGTKAWYDLLYPERDGNTADMIIKVEKQKEKEREKLTMLDESVGVSVEEYDSWDPTNNPDADPRPAKSSSLSSKRRNDSPGEPGSEPVSQRPRRQAAANASTFIAELVDQEDL